MPDASSQDYARAHCPRGLRKRLRRETAATKGVARPGSARRWWRLGLRGKTVSVWADRNDRLHFDVVVGAEARVNVLELGRRLQETVAAAVQAEGASEIAAIDVYIEPGL